MARNTAPRSNRPADYGSSPTVTPSSASPASSDSGVTGHPLTNERNEMRDYATTLHPSSASPTNPNRAKRHGARLPAKVRTTVKRDGLTRSGVTAILVDPATLRRSTAGGRNTSDRVVNGGEVLARNVLSRRSIRKTAVKVTV